MEAEWPELLQAGPVHDSLARTGAHRNYRSLETLFAFFIAIFFPFTLKENVLLKLSDVVLKSGRC
ncbi:hypothetical protein [Nitrosomonas mobilis]|uniref:Uncharacterized protein n=1 Tax=Nitrosomonas mobilis TaxID=51642 RepID=A0A1G5SIE0_9PROT|nr:hypothetical protein [Nitrosomonas mobilis]SCZ86139.1 hypothetical protein NSMM_490028 [Nitrosomonas mobilis]